MPSRQEFINNVTTWEELIDFCYDEDCEICDDIYSEESKNDEIDEDIVDWARDNTWEELYEILSQIPTGYDYYIKDAYEDFIPVTDELFESRKQEVLEWMDDGDGDESYWGDWDCNDSSSSDEDDDLEPIEPEDISLDDLFNSSNEIFNSIDVKETNKEVIPF